MWFADRPEVKEWQKNTKAYAELTGETRTLMGRSRMLHGVQTAGMWAVTRAHRMAINTPIQGGAADVVMMAMLKIHRNYRLKELGWRMILQVHDEVICEGPKESVKEALKIVKHCMEFPFFDHDGICESNLVEDHCLMRVELAVDANHADTWYEAK